MTDEAGLSLARGLRAATTTLEALRTWTRAVDPPAELVIAIDPVALCPTTALRRQAGDWVPVALPPVRLARMPAQPSTYSLAEGRREALDDLLFSLRLDQVLVLPLDPVNAGALVLVRAHQPYSGTDIAEQAPRTRALARALAPIVHRRQEASVAGPSREVAVLFELAHDLARAAAPLAAARAAADCLCALLRAPSGAVLVRIARDEPPVAVAWPEGDLGREAAARAAEGAGLPVPEELECGDGPTGPADDLVWLVPPGASDAAALALAWTAQVPDSAPRIAGAVQASLALAADRLAAEHRRERDRLRAVVEALPQGVALLAPGGRVRLVNPLGRAMLDALGAWPADSVVLHRIASVELAPLLAEACRGGDARAEIYAANGGRTIELRVVPAGSARGAGDGGRDALLVLEDVTEVRRHKSQLARSEKLSALGVLISGIVHEINNPLATIMGYAEMLGSAPASPSRETWLRTLADEAQRCQRIVGNLLAFARPQEPGRRTVSLAAIAERALSLVAHSFRSARIEAVLQVAPDLPAIDADPDAMLQALINLLTNALHALETHEGARQVSVHIAPGPPDCVTIEVRDTGPGIAPAHLDRVFDPFFTTKPEGKGTGLGLSLVAATVRDHGGTIDVESAPAQGACFRIQLPAKSRGPDVLAPAAAAGQASLRGMRVLVVDDEPAVAGVLAEMLEQSGAIPQIEDDAARALESMLAAPPAAIIWDFSLASLSGPELLADLERRAPELVARLIFASGDMASLPPGRPAGSAVPPVLHKPFRMKTVLDTVAAVSSGRPTADEGLH